MVHDGHALADVIGAVTAHIGTLRLGIADLADDVQLAGVVVKLSLHIGEAIDTADDLRRILAQAVQDDPQRLLAGLVCVAHDADSALGSGKGLVASKESEALGLVAQQHRAQVAVTETDLAILGHGAVDAERLQGPRRSCGQRLQRS